MAVKAAADAEATDARVETIRGLTAKVDRALEAVEKRSSGLDELNRLLQRATSFARTAEANLRYVRQLQAPSCDSEALRAELEQAWDEALWRSNELDLQNQIQEAKNSHVGAEVQRALQHTHQLESLALQADERADARVRAGQAENRRLLADKVQMPAGPFYFATAAHFPIRRFGLKGDLPEDEGVIIYEDMCVAFDRDGNYEIQFCLSTPAMPVELRLQLLVQPCKNGSIYTVTLPKLTFEPPVTESSDPDEEGRLRYMDRYQQHVHAGHSEILKRCYAELGQGANLSRRGTARMGFGVDVVRRPSNPSVSMRSRRWEAPTSGLTVQHLPRLQRID